jgi:hypothetical protein
VSTSDRLEFETAMVLDQALLDRMQDSLFFGLNMVADIETPDGFMRVSDGNQYVGSTFYEALAEFPTVRRTLGEWLNPALEFSTLEIAVSNVDGRFNKYIAGGANFDGWIGKTVQIRLGLRDVESTYFTIFSGRVTDVAGFQRDRSKIVLTARDRFDTASVKYPKTTLTKEAFPDLEDDKIGVVVPYVYGDWTVEVNANGASVPAFTVNGAHVDVLAGTANVSVLISENANRSFDTAKVYLQRSDKWYLFNAADITAVVDNRAFEIIQGSTIYADVIDPVTGIVTPEALTFQYQDSDKFWVQVKGKFLDSLAYSDNAVWIARDILITHGGLTSGDFAANWATYRDKSSPPESAIANIKARRWRQEPESAALDARQLLAQVRLEFSENQNLQFEITALHFDEFPDVSTINYSIRNWDVQTETFVPKLDDRNVWNRAKADYNYDPVINENAKQTPIFKNDAAIAQAKKDISKKVVFPDLYVKTDVENQLKEMLKVASGYSEFVDVVLTPRSVKKDIGQFVKINVQVGSTIFQDVPAMIRDIGYDPNGFRVPMKLWSFQMLPYTGYTPTYPATAVGGATATITQE